VPSLPNLKWRHHQRGSPEASPRAERSPVVPLIRRGAIRPHGFQRKETAVAIPPRRDVEKLIETPNARPRPAPQTLKSIRALLAPDDRNGPCPQTSAPAVMSLPANATHRLLAEAPALCQVISLIHQRGWCDGTGGNFSSVLCPEPLALLMAPSGVDKGSLRQADLIIVDGDGQVIGGEGKASAETLLHLTIIATTNAGAVLHTHSQAATLLSQLPPANGCRGPHWSEIVAAEGFSSAVSPASLQQQAGPPPESTQISPRSPSNAPEDTHFVPVTTHCAPKSPLCSSEPTNSVPEPTHYSAGSTLYASESPPLPQPQGDSPHDPGACVDLRNNSITPIHLHSKPENLLSKPQKLASDSEGLSAPLFKGYLRLSDLEMLKGLEGIHSHTTTIAIPILANSQDMRQLSQAASPHLATAPYGLLIAGHGLYVWGDTLIQARRHLEILEFLLEQAWRRCLLNALQSKEPT